MNEVSSVQRRTVINSDHTLQEPYPGATPLATAAWKGQVDKVKKLLKEGADVNKRSDFVDKGASPEAPLLLAIDKASTFSTCSSYFLDLYYTPLTPCCYCALASDNMS